MTDDDFAAALKKMVDGASEIDCVVAVGKREDFCAES